MESIFSRMHKRYIVCEGIDGAGKSGILNGFKIWCKKNDLTLFDVTLHTMNNGVLPPFDVISNYDAICVNEPTYTREGMKIRKAIQEEGCDAYFTADKYSKNREELLREIVVPFLNKGGWVFSDRSVISTLHYQPLQHKINGGDEKELLKKILLMRGNRYAIENSPDAIILAVADVTQAQERLNAREKKDNAIFDKEDFQRLLAHSYLNSGIIKRYQDNGCSIIHLSTHGEYNETVQRTVLALRGRYKLNEKDKTAAVCTAHGAYRI